MWYWSSTRLLPLEPVIGNLSGNLLQTWLPDWMVGSRKYTENNWIHHICLEQAELLK